MEISKVIDGIEETISYLRCHEGTHIERLIQHQYDALDLLKEQEKASKRNPVIVCPHCGKRVK